MLQCSESLVQPQHRITCTTIFLCRNGWENLELHIVGISWKQYPICLALCAAPSVYKRSPSIVNKFGSRSTLAAGLSSSAFSSELRLFADLLRLVICLIIVWRLQFRLSLSADIEKVSRNHIVAVSKKTIREHLDVAFPILGYRHLFRSSLLL